MSINMLSWNFYAEDIEDHSRVGEYIKEAARLGFGGIQMQLRDYRYQMDQQEVIDTVKCARDTAHRLGLTLWLHLDPRDAVSHFLEQYPHARQKNIVCLEIALENDRFETTYDYSRPATDHKQVDVAHTFDGIERVFAC